MTSFSMEASPAARAAAAIAVVANAAIVDFSAVAVAVGSSSTLGNAIMVNVAFIAVAGDGKAGQRLPIMLEDRADPRSNGLNCLR